MIKKLYLVDTITTYRHQYVIEAYELSHALDTITMEEKGLEEVTQKYLGETIIQGRMISKDDYDNMLGNLSVDKSELSSHWMGDELIHSINYEK